MAYAAVNVVLGFIFGNLYLGMTVGNIALYLLSVVCVFKLLKLLVTDRSAWEYTLLTAVYAVNPFVFGLANYNYWDNWVMYLWPIVIYFAVIKKWLYHFIFVFLMCFTKEPAVISYGFYCIGLIIIDWVDSKNDSLSGKCFEIVRKKKYWAMLTLGCSWLYVYKVLPNWDGVGGVELDGSYIWNKLSVFFVLNFNWILFLLGVGAIVCILKRRMQDVYRILFPLLISDIAFVVFSCLFKTVNHARYIDTHISVLIVSAIMGILLISRKHIRYAVAGCLTGLLFIACYFTYDPISIALFDHHNVGSSSMLSISGEILSDSMVYNQQYRYFDLALNKAMQNVIEEENAVTFFPELYGRRWFFGGNYLIDEADVIAKEYWSRERQKRVSNIEGDASLLKYDVCYIAEETDLESYLSEGKIGYYYYLPGVGDQFVKKIGEEFEVLDTIETSYRGWNVTRLSFKSED